MKNFVQILIFSLLSATVSVEALAQSNVSKEWNKADCKKDPFDDQGYVDCSMFIVELTNARPSIEEHGMIVLRMVRMPKSKREFIALQVTSKKAPPKLNGTTSVSQLLLRIDQKPVRTFNSNQIFIDKKPDGSIYQVLPPIDGLFLEEILAGKELFIRYTATNGGDITQHYSLNKFLEVFMRLSEEYDALAGSPAESLPKK